VAVPGASVSARPGTAGSVFDFERKIDDFAAKLNVTAEELTRDIVLATQRGCQEETPVDTGLLRANWQVTRDQPAAKEYGPGETAVKVSASLARNVPFAGFLWWVSNPVVYAKAIEYGHSKRRPNGMLRVTVESIRSKLDEFKRNAMRKAGLK
jgi:hypothetical protein